MNPSVIIKAANINAAQSHLFIEVGEQRISFVVLEDGTSFKALIVYDFSSKKDIAAIAEYFSMILKAEPLLNEAFQKIDIIWSFKESVLVPQELLNASANKAMLELVHGDGVEAVIKSDFMFRHGIYNVYRIPTAIHSVFIAHFPFVTHTHQYSLLPDSVNEKGYNFYVILFDTELTVVLLKEKKIQLVQNFSYAIPKDVAYHLLSICKNFNVEVASATLHLSGMLDESSNVYNELDKYFAHIGWETMPQQYQYIAEMKKYPSHFFSHLFAIAACV